LPASDYSILDRVFRSTFLAFRHRHSPIKTVNWNIFAMGLYPCQHSQRFLAENAFLHLKRWRGITTSYAENVASFVAAVQIRCIALWVKVL
jgi:hypothetical protein